MTWTFPFCPVWRFACLLLAWPTGGSLSAEEVNEEYFEREVRPILAARCYGCHSARVADPKGELRLDSRAGFLEGGASGELLDATEPLAGLLVQAIRREGGLDMPPDEALPADELAVLLRLIEAGAPWPEEPANSGGEFDVASRMAEHWLWQTPRWPVARTDADDDFADWCAGPLDRLVARQWPAQQLQPAPRTDREALARRAAIDLTGLPLPVAELDRFLRDRSPLAYERLIDRLLASPEFGELWGRRWLDAVRYAETYGHEFDYAIPEAYRYRDYVVDAINGDVPWDDWIEEHFLGDQLQERRRDPLSGLPQPPIATSVWWLGQAVHAPVDVDADAATRQDDQIDTLSKAFLGLTVACARCHDHKFDAISMQDYYSLAGMLSSTRRLVGWLDPFDRHQAHLQRVAAAASNAEAKCFGELPRLADAMGDLPPVAASPWPAGAAEGSLEHPAWFLDRMRDAEATSSAWDERWRTSVNEVQQAAAAYDQWLSQSQLIADRDGIRDRWIRTGPALEGEVDPQSVIDWFTAPQPHISEPTRVSSARWGLATQGALLSSSAILEKPVLCFRVRGRQTRLNTVVEDYFMGNFHGLLFSGMQSTIDCGRRWQWLAQRGDLHKYLGKRYYVECLDEGPGWFEIDEVRAAEQAPPPKPHAWLIELAQSPAPASFDELSMCYQRQWQESFARCSRGESTSLDREFLDSVPLNLSDAPDVRTAAASLQSLSESSPPLQRVLQSVEGDGVNQGIALRGNPHRRGEPVRRAAVEAFVSLVSSESPETLDLGSVSGRRGFVDRLLDPANPVVARTVVNRLWAGLFGRGVVDSLDNLGVLGGRPTHPELLDYMALDLQQQAWSVKHLIREIMLSETYRQSSRGLAGTVERDPDNRFLARMSLRRMTAESVRDSLLQAAGRIDRKMGGPSVAAHLTAQMQGRGRPAQSGPLDGAGRRSLYLEVRRNFLNPLLLAFDMPAPQAPQSKRHRTNVPAQALALWNDPLVRELAASWANHLCDETSAADERLNSAYLTAYGRLPTVDERATAQTFLQSATDEREAWTDLCHVLINTKEFVTIR